MLLFYLFSTTAYNTKVKLNLKQLRAKLKVHKKNGKLY